MAKPIRKQNLIQQKVLDGLIAITPSTWEKKELGKDEDGKEIVNTVKVVRSSLRYPLAQNVSDENVERLAARWLK